MSFIGNSKGKTYAPGLFLDHEECVRETKEIPQSMATTESNGTKYVKMGSAYPSNDGNIEGLVYEDVDVTNGNAPGSVVTRGGVVLASILPMSLTTTARTKLENLDFSFVSRGSVTRPY
jgi:hypothetical protein